MANLCLPLLFSIKITLSGKLIRTSLLFHQLSWIFYDFQFSFVSAFSFQLQDATLLPLTRDRRAKSSGKMREGAPRNIANNSTLALEMFPIACEAEAESRTLPKLPYRCNDFRCESKRQAKTLLLFSNWRRKTNDFSSWIHKGRTRNSYS